MGKSVGRMIKPRYLTLALLLAGVLLAVAAQEHSSDKENFLDSVLTEIATESGYKEKKPKFGYATKKPKNGYATKKFKNGYATKKPKFGYATKKPKNGYATKKPKKAAREEAEIDLASQGGEGGKGGKLGRGGRRRVHFHHSSGRGA